MSQFILERQNDGSWKQRQDNEGSPAMCMHSHVNAIEEGMYEQYRVSNSIVGGILPEEYIKRILIEDDGTMNIYTEKKE